MRPVLLTWLGQANPGTLAYHKGIGRKVISKTFVDNAHQTQVTAGLQFRESNQLNYIQNLPEGAVLTRAVGLETDKASTTFLRGVSEILSVSNDTIQGGYSTSCTVVPVPEFVSTTRQECDANLYTQDNGVFNMRRVKAIYTVNNANYVAPTFGAPTSTGSEYHETWGYTDGDAPFGFIVPDLNDDDVTNFPIGGNYDRDGETVGNWYVGFDDVNIHHGGSFVNSGNSYGVGDDWHFGTGGGNVRDCEVGTRIGKKAVEHCQVNLSFPAQAAYNRVTDIAREVFNSEYLAGEGEKQRGGGTMFREVNQVLCSGNPCWCFPC